MGRKASEKLERRMKSGHGPRPSRRQWRRRWLVRSFLALALSGGGIATWVWNGARAVPEPAPRFNLLASTGRVISLDEFVGKQAVVLIFYMVAT
jgi:hypothetical protein